MHMNERGGSCFPTHTQLKDETGLGRSTVIAALGTLEEKGYLVRKQGGGRRPGGNGKATEYTATVPLLDGSSPDTVQEVDANSPAHGHQDVNTQDDISREPNGSLANSPSEHPPKAIKVSGRNLPFDALAEVCGLDPGGGQKGAITAALNGRKSAGEAGIREQHWRECVAWAEANGRPDVLEQAGGERYERKLADAVRERARLYAERMPEGTLLTPTALRKWWTDLPSMAGRDGVRRTASGVRMFAAGEDDGFSWGSA